MVLYRLEDFDPKYQDAWGGDDIKGYDVYADRNNDKIGSVRNILLDEFGRFRYFVVDTGFWIFGKQVLLPVGRSRVDHQAHRIDAVGFTKQQAEHLPEFSSDLKLDYAYEKRVGDVYNYRAPEKPVEISAPLNTSIPVERSAPLDAPPVYKAPAPVEMPSQPRPVVAPQPEPDTYRYEQDPALYEMNDRDHQTLKLYEERLIANKNRIKAGEVKVNKTVETDQAQVAVPVEKERVVVEHTAPARGGRAVTPGANAFREGDVMQMEVYEETADIHKEAFVAEEVNIRKEVDHDTVKAKGKVRREKLNIETEGRPIVQEKV